MWSLSQGRLDVVGQGDLDDLIVGMVGPPKRRGIGLKRSQRIHHPCPNAQMPCDIEMKTEIA